MRRYRLLLHAFPKAWRARYGDELLVLLGEEERSGLSLRPCLDLLHAGLLERLRCLGRLGDRPEPVASGVVVLKSAADARRRRAGRWAAVALPLLVAATAAPFALGFGRHPLSDGHHVTGPPPASVISGNAAVSSSAVASPAVPSPARPCDVSSGPWSVAYDVVDGTRVSFGVTTCGRDVIERARREAEVARQRVLVITRRREAEVARQRVLTIVGHLPVCLQRDGVGRSRFALCRAAGVAASGGHEDIGAVPFGTSLVGS